MTAFTYCGDTNIENGGTFYDTSNMENGYADAFRVTPCSDAGGPDNIFWIEALTLLIPESESERAAMVSVLGLTGSDQIDDNILCEAALVYGSYDPMNCFPFHHMETVQVGPSDPFYDGPEVITPTIKLRSDAELANFVQKFIDYRT